MGLSRAVDPRARRREAELVEMEGWQFLRAGEKGAAGVPAVARAA